MAAAAALWADDCHVVANRDRYREKIDLAEAMLAGRAGFYRPPGGFFLWLDVGDGVAVTTELWRRHHVKVLPGAYLTGKNSTNSRDEDPGDRYIRVALVHEPALLASALERLAATLP
jgi:N-succinyldiaminopimelate aminotransferase